MKNRTHVKTPYIVTSMALDDGGASTLANDELEVHPSCSVHDCVACAGLAKVFYLFFLLLNPYPYAVGGPPKL